ncbi:hypothetical protein NN561_019541 [Cricetulus griseus]
MFPSPLPRSNRSPGPGRTPSTPGCPCGDPAAPRAWPTAAAQGVVGAGTAVNADAPSLLLARRRLYDAILAFLAVAMTQQPAMFTVAIVTPLRGLLRVVGAGLMTPQCLRRQCQ